MEPPTQGYVGSSLTRLAFAVFAISFLPGLTWGQTSRGTMTGIITDAQTASVVGAPVTITNEQTNVARSTVTNEAGLYRFDAVDPGSYSLTVKSEGFQTYTKRQIPVAAAQTVSTDVSLEIGSTQQTIEIVAQTESVLQYEAPGRGGTVGTREAVNLPLANRAVTQLALTMPGVVTSRFGRGSGGLFNRFVANGARERSNNFMIDGADNNDISVAGEGLQIRNPDSVTQVSVQTSNFDSEFGRAGGAVVNVISKSGTNQFHGSALYVLDSTYDDAITNTQSLSSSIQERGRPPFGIEQWWGGTLGGPIKKNNTFFFGSFQQTRNRQQGTSRLVTLTSNGRATLNSVFPKGSNPRVDLYNDITGSINANSQPFLEQLGAGRPAIEFGTAIAPVSISQTVYEILGRVDHRISDRDQISGRYIYNDDKNPGNALINQFPGFETSVVTKNQSASIAHTHIFSPTFTNELRLNYLRLNPLFPNDAPHPLASGAVLAPQIQFETNTSQTQIGLDTRIPQGRFGNNYSLQDTMTFIKGTHSLRGGFDFLVQRSKQFAPAAQRGSLVYRSGGGFGAFANFVDDFAGSGGAVDRDFGDAAYYPDMRRLSFFFQDRWRATSDITLTLGVRYEYFGTPFNSLVTPAWTGLFNIDPVTFAGPFSAPNEVKKDLNNWSPSVGFNWSPSFTDGFMGTLFGNKKTVVRTGYQIGYESFFNNIASNAHVSTPNTIATSVPSVVSAAQPRGLPNALASVPASARVPNALDSQSLMAGDLVNPYIQRWSFGIQRELPFNILYDLSYVGSKGTRLFMSEDSNPLVPANLRTVPSTNPPIPANRLQGRIDSLQGSRNIRTNGGSSSFHSMQMSAQKRFSHGMQFMASYTFGRFIDNGSDIFSTANLNNTTNQVKPPAFGGLTLDRGLSSFHRKHRFVVSYLYELPMFRNQAGLAGRVLGGWQLSGLTTFESGVPLNVLNGQDADGLGGSTVDRPLVNPAGRAGVRARPDASSPTGHVTDGIVNGRPAFVPIDPAQARYIGLSAHTGPNPADGGNAGRNTEFTPGINNFDFSLTKSIKVREKVMLRFRADAFNVFNHPQYGFPSISPFSPGQGTISANVFGTPAGRFLAPEFADGGGRVMRYEIRLIF